MTAEHLSRMLYIRSFLPARPTAQAAPVPHLPSAVLSARSAHRTVRKKKFLSPATAIFCLLQTAAESLWSTAFPLSYGLNIKYMKFRLPQEKELHEPDVEIELDEYRSYNRSKRSGLKTSK